MTGDVSSRSSPAAVRSAREWVRLVAVVAFVFVLFHVAATWLGSDRGQAGLAVAAIVLGVLLAVERTAGAGSWRAAAQTLGLGRPARSGLLTAVAICVLVVSVVPLFDGVTGTRVRFDPGAAWLVPGLFAQGGVAEEALFRGFLFGHLRQGRSFWRAANLSMLPFAFVHLLLFTTMPPVVAVAALLLSLAISYPLAHLYDVGSATIWAPAMLHFVVQGTVKVVLVSGESAPVFPLVWMAASATLPLLVFAVRRPGSERPATTSRRPVAGN